jgi:hypothetical protein
MWWSLFTTRSCWLTTGLFGQRICKIVNIKCYVLSKDHAEWRRSRGAKRSYAGHSHEKLARLGKGGVVGNVGPAVHWDDHTPST